MVRFSNTDLCEGAKRVAVGTTLMMAGAVCAMALTTAQGADLIGLPGLPTPLGAWASAFVASGSRSCDAVTPVTVGAIIAQQ
jgi:hypothetical protein